MKKSTIDKLKRGYSSSKSIPVKTKQTSRVRPHQYYDQDSVATTKARLRREEEAFQKARTKTEERKAAEQARDEQFNADVDQIDFMTMDEDASQKAEQKYKQLCAAVVVAEEAEKDAIQKLWSAKYDTMTTKQLQAAVIGASTARP